MLNPNEAFIRLKKEGKFTDDGVTWYWYAIGNGYSVMTSKKGECIPYIHRGFYIQDQPIKLVRSKA